jgi:hypothetical protein
MPRTLQQKLNKLRQEKYDLENKLNDFLKEKERLDAVCYEALLLALDVFEGSETALVARPKLHGALDLIEAKDMGQWTSDMVSQQIMKRALKAAIEIYQHSSLTRYELDATKNLRAFAERTLGRALLRGRKK